MWQPFFVGLMFLGFHKQTGSLAHMHVNRSECYFLEKKKEKLLVVDCVCSMRTAYFVTS